MSNLFQVHCLYIFALATLISLSGCTPRYSCKGFPDKRTCLSATEAYRATDTRDVADNVLEEEDTLSSLSPVHLQPDPERVTAAPYRSAPRVLKIWLAPYEDTEGDLHLPGTVYTELESRRWMIGQAVPKGTSVLKPLKASGPPSLSQASKLIPTPSPSS